MVSFFIRKEAILITKECKTDSPEARVCGVPSLISFLSFFSERCTAVCACRSPMEAGEEIGSGGGASNFQLCKGGGHHERVTETRGCILNEVAFCTIFVSMSERVCELW